MHNTLSRLQAIEFSSVIGLMRRAQRIWGRVMCVSGVAGMFRKSAIIDAGMFSPGMATEDIDMTWKLQTKFYDVRYEPSALVWMLVPETIDVWWAQRRRWALGLGQVLRRHSVIFTDWRWRRMHPLFIESAFSYLWSLPLEASRLSGSSAMPLSPAARRILFQISGECCSTHFACCSWRTWLDSKYDRNRATIL
jgi:biofilm PGA synthesis N-glycosyltransferase PgaC